MQMLVWAILSSVFLIIEVLVPALISIWLAISAFIVMLFSIFVSNIHLQALIFVSLSLLLIFLTKKLIKYDVKKDKVEVLVVKKIDEHNYEVRYKGSLWSAYSNHEFKENDKAYIKEFKGNKIILERGK